MKLTLLLSLLLLAKVGLSQKDTPTIRFTNPPSVATPKGYSQAAVIDLGTCKMVVMSGQVAFDKDGKLVGAGDFSRQAEQIFTNIRNIVESEGGTMDNVVRLGYYMMDNANTPTLRTIRDKYVNTQHPPTSTLVQVSKLFRDDVLFEVEAIAIIPKK